MSVAGSFLNQSPAEMVVKNSQGNDPLRKTDWCHRSSFRARAGHSVKLIRARRRYPPVPVSIQAKGRRPLRFVGGIKIEVCGKAPGVAAVLGFVYRQAGIGGASQGYWKDTCKLILKGW